jgi:S-adenosylmethionine-diacylglycerol 3-amino-3-carboxypropyl transferase
MTHPSPPMKIRADAAALWATGSLGKTRTGPPEIVFAQVREDAAVEVAALAACESPAVAFCIGSGGCTAFSLLADGLSKLFVVDINPAQIYLLELKNAALEHLPYADLFACMTADARPAYPALQPRITPEAAAFWDRRPHLLALGLNQCGIIERKLNRVMRWFLPLLQGRRRIVTMFGQTDLPTQRQYYRRHWDNWRWKAAFRGALSRPALRRLYGRPFVDRIPADFPRLIKERVDAVFLSSPIQENGYLWQTFLGKYPPHENGLPPYLRRKHHALIQESQARARLATADAAVWLEEQPRASIGFFALSNILEVTTPEYAARLLQAVDHSAKPGAVVCMRSIFPPAADDLRCCQEPFTSDTALSEELARLDRSLFCQFIQVLRVNR